jgi:hypothetical protein
MSSAFSSYTHYGREKWGSGHTHQSNQLPHETLVQVRLPLEAAALLVKYSSIAPLASYTGTSFLARGSRLFAPNSEGINLFIPAASAASMSRYARSSLVTAVVVRATTTASYGSEM